MSVRVVLLAALASALACAAGCNYVTPAAYFLVGPPQADAVYVPLDRPTLVFVDDRGNTISSNSQNLRVVIADRVSQDLMKQDIVTTTIDPRDAVALASNRDRHEDLLAIDEIGRLVGAEQVIYVEMRSFRNTTDGVTPRPNSFCEVRVIDVMERVRLFPEPDAVQAAHQVSVTMPVADQSAFRSRAGQLKLQTMLAEETGERIAKLFYKHEINELGEQLEPR